MVDQDCIRYGNGKGLCAGHYTLEYKQHPGGRDDFPCGGRHSMCKSISIKLSISPLSGQLSKEGQIKST